MPLAYPIADRPFGLSARQPAAAPFSLVHASGDEATAVVRDCLDQIRANPVDATIGFVYVSEEMGCSFETAIEILRLELPSVNWVGATVPSIFAGDQHLAGKPSVAVLLGDLALDQFRIMSTTRRNIAGQLDRLGSWRARNGACHAIVHGDANNHAVPGMLAKMQESLGGLAGGLTSNRGKNLQVAVSVTSGGLSGVLLGKGIELLSGHAVDGSALGLPYRVTASRGNTVIRLDHEPALDVLNREAGELLSRDPSRLAQSVSPACGPSPEAEPAYQQRRIVELNLADRSFTLDDLPDTMDSMRFYRRDTARKLSNFETMLADLCERLSGRPIRGAMLVSSANRPNVEEETAQELQLIRQTFGEIPLVGFRAAGEVYNGVRLGNSSVLTLIV